MLRTLRFATIAFVVLWLLLMGFGLLLNVTGHAPPRGCWSSSCEDGGR